MARSAGGASQYTDALGRSEVTALLVELAVVAIVLAIIAEHGVGR